MLQDLNEAEQSCKCCVFKQRPLIQQADDADGYVCKFNQMKISELMKKQKKCEKYIQEV